MKKTTYKKKKDNNSKKDLDLTNVYNYKGTKRIKARLKNNAKIAINNADELKEKYKNGTLGQKILIILMLFMILCLTTGIIFILFIIINAPDFNTASLYKKEASVFLDINGNEFARLGAENRELVSYDDLPQVLVDAIIATEDSRFFQHNGIDLARFSKAVLGQLLGHSDAGGGSTLTMQVAKNVYTDNTSSGIKGIIRKFTDIYMSVFKIERSYSKNQIIEFYVNIPYLGSSTYGVEQASQVYFGKSVGELSLAEAATIAGLFQAPDSYDPYAHPDLANQRKNRVLDLMYRHGYITEKQKNLAQSMSVENMLIGTTTETQKYAGFLNTVRSEIWERTKNDPTSTSMIVHTTLDPEKQDVIDKIYSGESYTWKKDNVEAAMTVVDVKTGAIVAVGARRNGLVSTGTNFATGSDVKRHPGSTAKPIFDYGPAIEYLGWSTGQTIVDDTYSYSGGTKINNFDRGYKGIMTIKTALAQSRNIPALETFQKVNQEDIKEFVENLGITPEYSGDSSFIHEAHSIGGFTGVNALQLAAAYATFSRGGTYIEPFSFTKIEYTNSDETYTVKPIKRKAMSDSTAYLINMILKYAVTSGSIGTGTVSGTDVASKTGTSSIDSDYARKEGLTGNLAADSWQVTYSPDYAIALWYGCENTTKECYITMNEGSSARYTISNILGRNILKPNSRWTQPSSVIQVQVEKETDPLALPSEGTPSDFIITEYFKKGTQPTEKSFRFEQLENPTDVKYEVSDKGIVFSWKPIQTPKAIDTEYLKEYFSKNIYKAWGDKYLNKRIEYNEQYMGDVVYSIYLNGELLDTTTENTYTYKGAIKKESKVTIKAGYEKYSNCDSTGVNISVAPTNGKPTDEPTTSPNTNNDNIDFSFVLNGTTPLSKEEFTKIVSENLPWGTVVSDGKDVTKNSTITYACKGGCNQDSFTLVLTVKYKNKSKNYEFAVKSETPVEPEEPKEDLESEIE